MTINVNADDGQVVAISVPLRRGTTDVRQQVVARRVIECRHPHVVAAVLPELPPGGGVRIVELVAVVPAGAKLDSTLFNSDPSTRLLIRSGLLPHFSPAVFRNPADWAKFSPATEAIARTAAALAEGGRLPRHLGRVGPYDLIDRPTTERSARAVLAPGTPPDVTRAARCYARLIEHHHESPSPPVAEYGAVPETGVEL